MNGLDGEGKGPATGTRSRGSCNRLERIGVKRILVLAVAPLVASLVAGGCSAGDGASGPVPSDTSSVQESLSLESSCKKIANVIALSDGSARSLQVVGDNLAKLEPDVQADLQPHVSELANELQNVGKPAKVLALRSDAQIAREDLVEQCDETSVELPVL